MERSTSNDTGIIAAMGLGRDPDKSRKPGDGSAPYQFISFQRYPC